VREEERGKSIEEARYKYPDGPNDDNNEDDDPDEDDSQDRHRQKDQVPYVGRIASCVGDGSSTCVVEAHRVS